MPERIGFYCAKHEQFSESGACNYCEPATALVARSGCPTSLKAETERGPLTAEKIIARRPPPDHDKRNPIGPELDRILVIAKKHGLLPGPPPMPLTAQEIAEMAQDESLYFRPTLPPRMTAESVRASMQDRMRNLFDSPLRKPLVSIGAELAVRDSRRRTRLYRFDPVPIEVPGHNSYHFSEPKLEECPSPLADALKYNLAFEIHGGMREGCTHCATRQA